MSAAERPLQGRAAVVTGAARRRGIGAAVVRVLAAAGADVLFTTWPAYDRAMPWGADEAGAEALLEEARRQGVRCHQLEIDLSDPGAATAVLAAANDLLGNVAILVNNAAHSTSGGYLNLNADTLDAHYAVNVRAAALLSVEFARRFTGSAGGRVINLTSGQSLGPMPDELAYAATKGAIEAFTRSLAPALLARGITVNAVNPGPTDTGWMSDAVRAEPMPRFPTGRLGQPEDAARLVAFLAGDEAAWITGQVIHAEGGFRRG